MVPTRSAASAAETASTCCPPASWMVVRSSVVIVSPRETSTLVAMTLTVRVRFVVTHHTPIPPRRTSAMPRAMIAGAGETSSAAGLQE
ncbi:hypothetical protein AB1285_27205 [Microbacterium sp. NRRL B-14842]|uniref:hypothetical protein n=1 Tax=Microbacterium sp. NRRL B-14842 TaxID=3162881 RepID=UPI003D2D017A